MSKLTPLQALHNLMLVETHCLHASFEPGPAVEAAKAQVAILRERLSQYVPTGDK